LFTGVQPTVPRSCGVTDGAQLCVVGMDVAVWSGLVSVHLCWCPTPHPPQPWGDAQCVAAHCRDGRAVARVTGLHPRRLVRVE
jgi:hypothetical protein